MMPKILDAQVLIVRGNYPNFHNKMINFYDPKSTIFYPATSLFFPHFGERIGNWIERVMLGFHDIDEIKLVISRLTEESIFSRVKPPVIRTPRSKTDDLQMRRSVRNYCLECIKISKSILTRESPWEYSIVLYDEKKNLEILTCKYPNASLLPFKGSIPYLRIQSSVISRYRHPIHRNNNSKNKERSFIQSNYRPAFGSYARIKGSNCGRRGWRRGIKEKMARTECRDFR